MKLFYKILGGLALLLMVAVGAVALVIQQTDDCPTTAWDPVDGQAMQSVNHRCYGGPEVLETVEVARPVPEADQLLVRVHAAAVNPLDWHYMRGSPFFMRLGAGLGAPEDTRLGVDFAGTVIEVGDEVTRFAIGDAVFGGASGAFSDYLVIGQDKAVARKPDNVSFDEAAAVPIAAITALQALRDKGQLAEGQQVLINGASGGVGTYAVQIAKAMGAEVTGVCSGRNEALVRSLGADHVINYQEQDYTQLGKSYDLIVDNVGNHLPLANRAVLKPGGRLVIVGGGKGDWLGPMAGPILAMMANAMIDEELITLMAYMKGADMQTLADMMAAGDLRSAIDRRYTLDEIQDAIAYSESGRARGKIIITMAQD